MRNSARVAARFAGTTASILTLACITSAFAAPGAAPPGGFVPPGGGTPGQDGHGPGPGDFSTFAPPIIDEGAPPIVVFDHGDAPDLAPLCGDNGGLGFFPTLRASQNARSGREGPFHFPVPVNDAINLGRFINFEAAPPQPLCDWQSPGCDSFGEDGALLLCFDPKCRSGIMVGNSNCGPGGFGAYFGPPPAADARAFWIFYTTRGASAFTATRVNVATDADQTGRFDDHPEAWALRDAEVDLIPGATQFFQTNSFPVGHLITPLTVGRWDLDPFWSRLSLSDETLAATFDSFWDGSGPLGGYNGGETEDWMARTVQTEFSCRVPTHGFESSAVLSISLDPFAASCSEGTGVPVTSAGQPLGVLREFRNSAFVSNRAVPVEFSALSLAGTSPELGGAVVVRERSDRLSIGVIDEVAELSGQFQSGKFRFGYWLEVDLPGLGLTLDTGDRPLILSAGAISAFPPIGAPLASPPGQVRAPLFVKGSSVQVGWVCVTNFAMTQAVSASCPGDADGNRIVDFGDVTAVLVNWGAGGPVGDSTGDCLVDFTDISAALVNWGAACR